jgi:hypothetical protein
VARKKFPRIERETRFTAVVREMREYIFWAAAEDVVYSSQWKRKELRLLHVEWSCGACVQFRLAEGRKLLAAFAAAVKDARRGRRSRRAVSAAHLSYSSRPNRTSYRFHVTGCHGNFIVTLYRAGQSGQSFKLEEADVLIEAARLALKEKA